MPEIDVTETFLNFSLVINKSMFLATFLALLTCRCGILKPILIKIFIFFKQHINSTEINSKKLL